MDFVINYTILMQIQIKLKAGDVVIEANGRASGTIVKARLSSFGYSY